MIEIIVVRSRVAWSGWPQSAAMKNAAGDGLVEGLRRRRMPVIRRGGVQPWPYIDDAATATVAALEKGTAGTAYNVADDEPVSFSELMTAMAAALGAPEPRVAPPWLLAATPYAKAVMTGALRVSNAKRDLGWAPQVPTYRDGVAAIADHCAQGSGMRRQRMASIVRGVDDRVVKKGMRQRLHLGLPPKAFALLVTTGWRTGLPRRTPVGNGLIGDTFWLIAARGEAAHYVRNLRHTPAVRVKIGHRWISGIAEVLPDDDPGQRLTFILAHFGWLRRLDARALESSIRLLDSDPHVVRISINEHSRPLGRSTRSTTISALTMPHCRSSAAAARGAR